MKIVEYDQVDPLGVLHLNLLSLGYALTPEKVALIRRLDPSGCIWPSNFSLDCLPGGSDLPGGIHPSFKRKLPWVRWEGMICG